MARVVYMAGQPVEVQDNANVQELRRTANVPRDRFLAVQNPNGQGYEIYDEKRLRLPQTRGDLQVMPLPRYRQGSDYNRTRIIEEIKILSHRFSVQFDDENLQYISIMEFPLSQGWSRSKTTLLIKIPEDYPKVPPVHFFMRKDLAYKGNCPSHYFKDNSFNEASKFNWGKYCIHVKGQWRPSNNVLDGDSLITYLELIKVTLDNMNVEEV